MVAVNEYREFGWASSTVKYSKTPLKLKSMPISTHTSLYRVLEQRNVPTIEYFVRSSPPKTNIGPLFLSKWTQEHSYPLGETKDIEDKQKGY